MDWKCLNYKRKKLGKYGIREKNSLNLRNFSKKITSFKEVVFM